MTTADRYHALAAQHAYERRAADDGPAALIEPYLGNPAALLPQQRRSTENQREDARA